MSVVASAPARLTAALSSCGFEQAARSCAATMKRKLRFLNMEPEQVNRRAARQRKQEQRIRANKSRRGAAEHANATPQSHRTRKLRPCCGLRCDSCTCTPPPGLRRRPLQALAQRYLNTPLKSTADTTDVSEFQRHMRDRCQPLPMWVVLLYCYVHVVFSLKRNCSKQ